MCAIALVAGSLTLAGAAAAMTDQECDSKVLRVAGFPTYQEAISKFDAVFDNYAANWRATEYDIFDRWDQMVALLVSCRANIKATSGQDLVTEARQSQWKRAIAAKADLFARAFSPRIEEWTANPQRKSLMLAEVYNSPRMRSALAKAKPGLIPAIEGALGKKSREAGATQAQRTATVTLPAAIGPWKKSGRYGYQRALPNGFQVEMMCVVSGGIGIEVTSPQPLINDATLIRQKRTWVPLIITTPTGERQYRSSLKGASVQGNTQNIYVNAMLFQIDDPQKRGAALPGMMAEQARQGRILAEKTTGLTLPPDDSGIAGYEAVGRMMQQRLANDTLNYGDIDQFRNLPSAKLTVYSEVQARRIELFDLEPTKPPFKSLMQACEN
jgi:hypothetical protein